ncbi:hypothetical protein [Streptomyces sp. NPDC050560]|uniref:hypothetical protein n=1 Tax=Streptomyces sp. NPDC050560 TaxID=3365630 RepID=UPI003792DE1E
MTTRHHTPHDTAGTTAPTDTAPDPLFDTARHIADAVLFEGYVLYPYRASAAKNRVRWQFGVLMPPACAGVGGEHADQRTECLMEPRSGARLRVRLRFLRAQRREVLRALPGGGHEPADALDLPDRVLVPWDEGVEEHVDVDVPVDDLTGDGVTVPFTRDAGEDTETVTRTDGREAGLLVRRRERVEGRLRLTATQLPGPYGVLRLAAVVENTLAWRPEGPADGSRAAALPHALLSAHLLLGLTAGSFLSMTDPPEWAAAAVAECRNERVWPVLAGREGRADAVLSSPIILEDHPRIAPESPGALYDATEIDEILALRTAALTDDEKREARGTDDRAGAVVDLADTMPPEVLERLHGAVRSLRPAQNPAENLPGMPPHAPAPAGELPWWDPAADGSVDPGTDSVLVAGRPVAAGSRVVLRHGHRRTDAQDAFLHGRTALVEAVVHDVDGAVHVAVTVDDDPGAELRRVQGRFLYFRPDELALPDGQARAGDG